MAGIFSTMRNKCETCPKHCDRCDELRKNEAKHIPNVSNRTRHHTIDSLCWCCKKAVEGGCDWIDKRVPVKHWDADLNKRKLYDSYHVNDCPEFERS